MGLPKFLYTLRTSAPNDIPAALKAFDELIHRTLVRILGGHAISTTAYTQSTLPLRLGGLGLRSAREHAPCAFLGSLCKTSSLQLNITNVLPPINAADEPNLLRHQTTPCLLSFTATTTSTSDNPVSWAFICSHAKPQQYCSSLVDAIVLKKLRATVVGSPVDLARLLSLSLPFASDPFAFL